MATPLWLSTTYTDVTNLMTTLDTWLVTTMGYTRNMAPTADTVLYTGYRAHYQKTFTDGQILYLNFHTNTSGAMLYCCTSRAYAAGSAWNAQTDVPKTLANAVVYSKCIVPVTTSNNNLRLFGDAKGNCMMFIQCGASVDIGDFMQWGQLDKTGFGSWVGGQYLGSQSLGASPVLTSALGSPNLSGESNASSVPRMVINLTKDSTLYWMSVKTFSSGTSSSWEPSSTLGTTSTYWTNCIGGSNLGTADGTLLSYDYSSSNSYYGPINIALASRADSSAYVTSMSGKITAVPVQYFVRHEATQRVSHIGALSSFAQHCPVACSRFAGPVVAGTDMVIGGRTFTLMGFIAAEKVSV